MLRSGCWALDVVSEVTRDLKPRSVSVQPTSVAGERIRPSCDDVSLLPCARGASSASSGRTARGKTTLLRLLAGMLTPQTGDGAARRRADCGAHAARPRAPHRRGAAGDARDVRLHACIDIVLMGRYPHLGPFELEGAGDLAIARAGARRDGHARTRGAAVRARSAAAKNSAWSSRARWRRRRTCCCSTSRPPRSISRYQLEIAALLRRLNADARHDDGRVDARPEPGGGAVRRRSCCCRTAASSRRARPTTTLTAGNIRALYGVDADVHVPSARRSPDGGADCPVALTVPPIAAAPSAR